MSDPDEVRESIVLSWRCRTLTGVFVKHAARGKRTLCGIELGESIADPPSLAVEGAVPCRHLACQARTTK